MEIADVFVVNKADRGRARDAVRELKQMLEMSNAAWKPDVVQTIATKDEGITDLWAAIEKHRAYQDEHGRLVARRTRRVAREIEEIVAARMRARIRGGGADLLARLTDDVMERRLDPYAAATRLIDSL